MNNRINTLRIAVLVMMFSLVVHNASAQYGKPNELVAKSTAVFKSFMADDTMRWFHDNVHKAKGIFIIPQMLRGGFIIGGSGGSGILLAQDTNSGTWSYPAFYTMGSVSFGLQAGADASEIILLIMTQKGLNAMLSTSFKLGADVGVAAGPVGTNAKAQTADILAFGRAQGVFGGVSLEGAIIQPQAKWNAEFYKKPISVSEILIAPEVSNPEADQIRAALPQSKPAPVGKKLGS